MERGRENTSWIFRGRPRSSISGRNRATPTPPGARSVPDAGAGSPVPDLPVLAGAQFWLERGPATVDYKGEVVERYGVTVSGYFGFERVADQVPKEYRPQ